MWCFRDEVVKSARRPRRGYGLLFVSLIGACLIGTPAVRAEDEAMALILDPVAAQKLRVHAIGWVRSAGESQPELWRRFRGALAKADEAVWADAKIAALLRPWAMDGD